MFSAIENFENFLMALPIADKKCLRHAVPTASSDFLLSSYWSYRSTLAIIIGENKDSQIELITCLLENDFEPLICAIQDAGLSINIGSYNIPVKRLTLKKFKDKKT